MPIIQTRIIDARIGTEFPLPTYATAGAAGLDLRACIDAPTPLPVGETRMIRSGIAIFIRDANYMAMLAPRSGLGVKHGIVLANTVGIIDSDYQDEIHIALVNRGNADYTISPGERICQLVLLPVVQAELEVVQEFSEATARGCAGFGSTGRQ